MIKVKLFLFLVSNDDTRPDSRLVIQLYSHLQ